MVSTGELTNWMDGVVLSYLAARPRLTSSPLLANPLLASNPQLLAGHPLLANRPHLIQGALGSAVACVAATGAAIARSGAASVPSGSVDAKEPHEKTNEKRSTAARSTAKPKPAPTPTTTTTSLVPTPNDIVLGRGKSLHSHPGNVWFRSLVADRIDAYEAANKQQKTSIAEEVVRIVEAASCRFLRPLDESMWEEIDGQTARLKVASTFRTVRRDRRSGVSTSIRSSYNNRPVEIVSPPPIKVENQVEKAVNEESDKMNGTGRRLDKAATGGVASTGACTILDVKRKASEKTQKYLERKVEGEKDDSATIVNVKRKVGEKRQRDAERKVEAEHGHTTTIANVKRKAGNKPRRDAGRKIEDKNGDSATVGVVKRKADEKTPTERELAAENDTAMFAAASAMLAAAASSPPTLTAGGKAVIQEPTSSDVLCGRGKHVQTHPGNIAFRGLVAARMGKYESVPKLGKNCVSIEIMCKVKAANGRFLKPLNGDGGPWEEIEDDEARLKVASAFRSVRKGIKRRQTPTKPI